MTAERTEKMIKQVEADPGLGALMDKVDQQRADHAAEKVEPSRPTVMRAASPRSILVHWYRCVPCFVPTSQADCNHHCEILVKIQANPKRFLQKILQGRDVRESGGLLQCGLWSVVVKGYVNKAGNVIPCTGFFNEALGLYGTNLIELLAVIKNIDYARAMDIAARNLAADEVPATQKDARAWYRHERNPVCFPPRQMWSLSHSPGCRLIAEHEYARIEGHPYMYVSTWSLPGDTIVTLYMSLVRHFRSQALSWCEIGPNGPYPLFNEFALDDEKRAAHPVVLCDSEREAASRDFTTISQDILNTACPGGLGEVRFTDLSLLSGRDVYVHCTQVSATQAVRALRRLSGLQSVQVILEGIGRNGKLPENDVWEVLPCEEFLDNLEQFDVTVKEDEQAASFATSLVTAPGSRIPGADIERQMVLSPILRGGDIVWLYGDPKSCKTWLGLSMAYAVAKGNLEIGKWTSEEPKKVLYVDGEMLADDLTNRIKMIAKGQGHSWEEMPFHVICAKATETGSINVLEEEIQNQVLSMVQRSKIDMIVLDNVHCLTDNKVNEIRQLITWLFGLARMGVAVLVLDHTNSEGKLQGSASKNRMASLTVKVETDERNAEQVEVSFPAARNLHGEDALSLKLENVFGKDSFRVEVVEEPETEEIMTERMQQIATAMFLRENEVPLAEIASQLGIGRSTVYNRLKGYKDLPPDDATLVNAMMQQLRENGSHTD